MPAFAGMTGGCRTHIYVAHPLKTLSIRLDQCQYIPQIIHYRLQFRNRLGDQHFRARQLVGVFQGVILEPGDVQFVVAFLDLAQVEFAKAPVDSEIAAVAAAVGIGAVAGFELGEMGGGEGAFFLGDAGHVRAGVEDPRVFRAKAFLEEDDVGFYALAVGGESAARQAQDGVKIAILHEDFEDLTRFAFEEAIVGKYNGGPAAGLENVHAVLHEVELLVAGGDGEVVPVGRLVGSLGAEGGIGEHARIALASIRFVDRIAEIDPGFESMQEKVHEGQAPGAGDQLLAQIGPVPDALDDLPVESAVRLFHQPFVGTHEKPAGAAGGIADGELRIRARVRLHHPDDGFDQFARGKVLAGALFALACRFFQETLEGGALDVHVHGRPFFIVDERDQPLEVHGVVEARHGLSENVAEQSRFFAEGLQGIGILVEERLAGFLLEAFPVQIRGDGYPLFIGHF